MKLLHVFCCLFLLLTKTESLKAQPPSGKCLSGNCKDGFGKYQLNSYTEYEGNFSNGLPAGNGKIFSHGKLSIEGNFTNNIIDNSTEYGISYWNRSYHLLFTGRYRMNVVSWEVANQNWKTVNYNELNGNYFTIQKDSGSVYLDYFFSDTVVCIATGKFNDGGQLYGPGKVSYAGREMLMDFGAGSWPFDEKFIGHVRLTAKNQKQLPWEVAKCISGNCVNGTGVARLNNFSTYEGGFKNGSWYGQGKVSHDSSLWYYTGFFSDSVIRNYNYYSVNAKSKTPVLYMRTKKIPLVYYDRKYAENNWTTNNFNVLNGKFFQHGKITDTSVYYFKPDFLFMVLPGNRRAVLKSGNKVYGFMINPDKPYWTEEVLREHLVRGKYATNRTYIYYPDILNQPSNIPPFADYTKPVAPPANNQTGKNSPTYLAELKRRIEQQQLKIRDKLVLKPGYTLIDKGFFGNDTRVTRAWLGSGASFTLFISFPTGDKFEILDNDGNPCACDVYTAPSITDVVCNQQNKSPYTDLVQYKFTIRVLKGKGPFYYTTFLIVP